MTLPDFRSPVDLPEGKTGKFEVKHTHGDCFDIVSMREAITTGRQPLTVKLEEPIRIHELYEEGKLWIADVPIEVRQHQESLSKMEPRGRVLVGGLGLGIMAGLLAKRKEVTQVDVVEISPEVARLCKPTDPKVKVIVQDFRAFVAAQRRWEWDCAFVDLWRGTSEGDWWEEVLPIRRLIANKFGLWYAGTVEYWAEDIMLGQVGRRLMEVTDPHWFYKAGLKLPMSKVRARWFFNNIGSPRWEKKYGVLYPKGGGTVEQDETAS